MAQLSEFVTVSDPGLKKASSLILWVVPAFPGLMASIGLCKAWVSHRPTGWIAIFIHVLLLLLVGGCGWTARAQRIRLCGSSLCRRSPYF